MTVDTILTLLGLLLAVAGVGGTVLWRLRSEMIGRIDAEAAARKSEIAMHDARASLTMQFLNEHKLDVAERYVTKEHQADGLTQMLREMSQGFARLEERMDLLFQIGSKKPSLSRSTRQSS